MIFYFIRHARQDSTLCNVDVPLAKAGEAQAALLGKRMKNYPVDALYTSDLIRAVQTAEIAFASQPQLLKERVEKEALREFDFGILHGQKDEAVKGFYQQYYLENLPVTDGKEEKNGNISLKRQRGLRDMAYPEGESGREVFERVRGALEEMMASGKQHIAVVTHGGVIRLLVAALFGGSKNSRLLFGTSLENCSITQIHYEESKKLFFLDRFNDYAHLEEDLSLLRQNWKGNTNA